MKNLNTICTIGLVCFILHSEAQTNDFQVIYARNVFKGNELVANLAWLRPSDELMLTDGYLIIGHISGTLMEYGGNELVSLSKLYAQFQDVSRFSYDRWFHLEIDYSFLYDSINSFKPDRMVGAMPHVYPEDLELVYPYFEESAIMLDCPMLEFGWRQQGKHINQNAIPVVLQFETIYGEHILDTLTTTDYFNINIPQQVLDSLSSGVVVSLKDTVSQRASYSYLLVPTPTFSDRCTDKTGIEALEIGIRLEMLGLIEGAAKYYSVAGKTSNNIFSELELNFLRRNDLFDDK